MQKTCHMVGEKRGFRWGSGGNNAQSQSHVTVSFSLLYTNRYKDIYVSIYINIHIVDVQYPLRCRCALDKHKQLYSRPNGRATSLLCFVYRIMIGNYYVRCVVYQTIYTGDSTRQLHIPSTHVACIARLYRLYMYVPYI